MPNIAISVLDVASIKAEAHAGVLWLTVKSSDGQSAEFITFSLGRQGKALRMAGAINSIQEDDDQPIYPAAERRFPAITEFNAAVEKAQVEAAAWPVL